MTTWRWRIGKLSTTGRGIRIAAMGEEGEVEEVDIVMMTAEMIVEMMTAEDMEEEIVVHTSSMMKEGAEERGKLLSSMMSKFYDLPCCSVNIK